MTGLHPASMYTLSVVGKTVGLGPALTQCAATRPPALLLSPPDVSVANRAEWTWQTQTDLSKISNSSVYSSLIRYSIQSTLRGMWLTWVHRLNSREQCALSSPIYLLPWSEELDSVYSQELVSNLSVTNAKNKHLQHLLTHTKTNISDRAQLPFNLVSTYFYLLVLFWWNK